MTVCQIQHDFLGFDYFLLRLKELTQQIYYYSLLLVNLRVYVMRIVQMCPEPFACKSW